MAETIMAGELARVMGTAKTTVLRMAEKEGWYHENGGNRVKRFVVSDLPAEIRNRIIQTENSVYLKGMILPLRADMDLAQAKALLTKYENAPDWCRHKAEARGEIVDAFDRFSEGKKLTEATARFLRRYNAGNNHLGISLPVYELFETISKASLNRWRGLKKTFGLVGLLESTRNRKSFGALTPDMQHYIIGVKRKKINTRPVRICEYLRNKFSGPDVDLPSDATIRRFISTWEQENASLVAFLKDPDKWRSDFQAAFGNASEKAKCFLHMVEFDNTPADIMCADGKRYTITGAIDIFSRKAACQVVPTAKSQAVANLMRWIILNWGLFDVAILDNGQDYASKHIEAACGAMGIEIDFTPPFTPEDKPHIERFFRSMSMMLFEELSGYIGHCVADRKAIESQKSFAQRMFGKDEVIECRLMPDDLQDIINVWLDNIYHQREHRTLGKSPEARAGESSQPVKRILDERVLDILLAPVGKPSVLKKGIRFDNGIYAAVELATYIGERVQIRRDLADAGKLYVFDAESKYICIAKDNSLEGISVEDANIARKRQKKRVTEQAHALKALAREVGDPMMDLLESKREASGQVFSFRREEAYENEAMREAAKAVTGVDPVETFEAEIPPGPPLEKGGDKVVKLHEEPLFESGLERYKYLEQQMKIRTLTGTETAWREGYMSTDEYYKVFVMPYE